MTEDVAVDDRVTVPVRDPVLEFVPVVVGVSVVD